MINNLPLLPDSSLNKKLLNEVSLEDITYLTLNPRNSNNRRKEKTQSKTIVDNRCKPLEVKTKMNCID